MTEIWECLVCARERDSESKNSMGTTKERREQSEGDAATTHLTTTATATTGAIVAAGVTTTLPATKTTTTAADTSTTNAAKKIRRTFSMPRNPFRWTRKFKTAVAVTSSAGAENDNESGKNNGARERRGSHTAISSCVGGGRGRSGSIVSLSSYEAPFISSTNNNTTTASNGNNNNSSSSNINSKRTRALRRSSFRKFLNRIAQHLSSTVNVVVSAEKCGKLYISKSKCFTMYLTIHNSTIHSITITHQNISWCPWSLIVSNWTVFLFIRHNNL